ncbi:pentraxin-4 isoform X2 [Epinephelus fuscoguttatus]|nr:pentraxin-4 isoform X2 [Epinephelus fuscoguttatus]
MRKQKRKTGVRSLLRVESGKEESTCCFSISPRIMRFTAGACEREAERVPVKSICISSEVPSDVVENGKCVLVPACGYPRSDPGSQLHLSQLCCTMGSFSFSRWPLILLHMLLLQIQAVQVQGIDPVSQKLRRLNEQFQQFQALTQARLDMLAQNQNRNFSGGLESRVQALSDHWRHMTQDLEQLKQSTTQEIEGLREWSRKLEKKSKRMEGRLALMERNLRESRRQAQKQKPEPEPGQDFFNLTLELQSQEERLAALQVQRDELLIGLKGLQESLKNQALRVTRLEGRVGEVLQQNGGGKSRGLWRMGEPFSSNITPQENYDLSRRSQTQRGERPGRILDTQPRPEGIGYSQTDDHPHPQPYQYQATPNQPKHSKTQRQRPQPEYPVQYSNPKPHSTEYLPQPDRYPPQSQIQVPAQIRPYPIHQEQLQSRQTVPNLHAQLQQQSQPHIYRQRHAQLHNPSHRSWPLPLRNTPTGPEPNRDRQSGNSQGAPQGASDDLPQPQPKSYQPRVSVLDGGKEEESDTKVESSVIHNFLQLPLRHKIPTRPVPKKDATICNVDSMLFFPSASAENYVTFFRTLPDLPELSVCLWLRVEASHVGTLLSYATDDNDNQLVLYGRNSSASPASFFSSSSSSHPLYASSSSPSLDFVIGDPVYRRLPTSSLLDGRWHHLCVLWSSIQGRLWHYSDRRLASSGSNFRKGWEIPGGGSVVLGQEQDTVGGGFDPAEGFVGQVAGFRVWNRVLSGSEVEGVAEGRGVPRGVVLGMEDIKEVHGEVQQVACECLEHCV